MAKFKLSNIDTWESGEDMATNRIASVSDSRIDKAQRVLDAMEAKKKSAQAQYKQEQQRFSSKKESEYDFESRMHSTKHAGHESEFSEVRDEEDFENMNMYASNQRSIKRSGYENSEDSLQNLSQRYFTQGATGVLYDPELLSEILLEKELKKQAVATASQRKEEMAMARRGEMESRQDRVRESTFGEDSAFEGLNFADLSASKIRKTANEAKVGNKFGIFDQEQMERKERLRNIGKEAKIDRSKGIKRASISEEEKRDAWEDYDLQRGVSIQDKYSNSPIINGLQSAMRK